jgi:PAS domain S-box-containing protein
LDTGQPGGFESDSLGSETLAQRLSVATRAAGLGIWEWDLVTNRFYYSARAREICGFPPSGEINYEMVTGVTHPEDLPRTQAMATRALDPQIRAVEPYVYRIVRRGDGGTLWVEAHGEATFSTSSEGDVRAIRYTGTLLDITEARLAAQKVSETEARLRLAVEAGGLAIWEIDLATQEVTHSPALNIMCGFGADDRPTLDEFRARYAPGERERIQAEGAAARARGDRTFQNEIRQIWPDGTERWLLLRAQVAPGEPGYDGRIIGVLMDVTERRQQEELFREMANNAPVVVWVSDGRDELTFIGRAWEQLTGQSPLNAKGHGWLDVVHPEDVQRVALSSVESTRSKSRYEAEYRVRSPAGDWRWVLDTATPRLDASGQFLGHIGSIVDVTERRRREDDRKLLIHELNHRIKNTLSIAQVLARQTLRNAGVDGSVQESLVGRFVAMASAQEAIAAESWNGSDLRFLISSALKPFESHDPARIQVDGEPIGITARSTMSLSLAIHELATNAAKYGALSTDNGRLEISWTVDRPEAEDRSLTITWQETGGPPVSEPTKSGFGSVLLDRVLTSEFGAEVDREFACKGLIVTLRLPLVAVTSSDHTR